MALKYNGSPAIDRGDLEQLVEIFTWGPLPMELANFTDDELAAAINELRPTPRITAADVAKTRGETKPGAAFKELLRRPPKVEKDDLAAALWPPLEARLKAAQEDRHLLNAIPIARLVLRAAEKASEWPRQGLALRLEQAGRRHI